MTGLVYGNICQEGFRGRCYWKGPRVGVCEEHQLFTVLLLVPFHVLLTGRYDLLQKQIHKNKLSYRKNRGELFDWI